MDDRTVKKIAECFENLNGRITLGVDGYVDEVWQVVESRISRDSYALYNKMKKLGETIIKCGDGGLSQEIVRKRRTYGGFTGNTGKALGSLGVKPIMIGMFGKSSIDPVFEQFNSICELVSVGDPATCHVFEFEDGKIMFPYIEAILNFSWDTLAVDFDRFKEIFLNSDIIALGYWSSMPSFDELVSKFAKILSKTASVSKCSLILPI
jgi:hypothetical protein